MRSLQYTESLEKCVGVTVFCYQHLWDRSTGVVLASSKQEHEAFAAYLKDVSWHKAD